MEGMVTAQLRWASAPKGGVWVQVARQPGVSGSVHVADSMVKERGEFAMVAGSVSWWGSFVFWNVVVAGGSRERVGSGLQGSAGLGAAAVSQYWPCGKPVSAQQVAGVSVGEATRSPHTAAPIVNGCSGRVKALAGAP